VAPGLLRSGGVSVSRAVVERGQCLQLHPQLSNFLWQVKKRGCEHSISFRCY
jgi:hypothetical protein